LTNFRVKENSWIAKVAAKKLKAESVAIVIGKTIHLHNTCREDFLADEAWVKHELCHVEQFRKYGFFTFIFKYLAESWRKGYYNNKFEVEARDAER
jgi:hypothetical protein